MNPGLVSADTIKRFRAGRNFQEWITDKEGAGSMEDPVFLYVYSVYITRCLEGMRLLTKSRKHGTLQWALGIIHVSGKDDPVSRFVKSQKRSLPNNQGGRNEVVPTFL